MLFDTTKTMFEWTQRGCACHYLLYFCAFFNLKKDWMLAYMCLTLRARNTHFLDYTLLTLLSAVLFPPAHVTCLSSQPLLLLLLFSMGETLWTHVHNIKQIKKKVRANKFSYLLLPQVPWNDRQPSSYTPKIFFFDHLFFKGALFNTFCLDKPSKPTAT